MSKSSTLEEIEEPLQKKARMRKHVGSPRIQNAVSIMIAVLVAIWKNRSNTEIAFHITAKTRFGQLRNLSNATVSSRIGHILNPWLEHGTREQLVGVSC